MTLEIPDTNLLAELAKDGDFSHSLEDLCPEVIRLMAPCFSGILRRTFRIDKKERGELTNKQRAYAKAYVKAKRAGKEPPPSPFKKRGYTKRCHPEDSGEKPD